MSSPVTSATPIALIIDDDAVFRVTTLDYLEEAGFDAREAEDGLSGLTAFDKLDADIVLLDVMMPDMDGFTVSKKLRASPKGEHVPILMITGADDIESVNRAFNAGASDFATKPVNHDLLIHRIRYMLRAKEVAATLRERENSLAHAQRIAKLGNWEWDLQSDQFRFSDQMKNIFGWYSKDIKITHTAMLDAIHPKDKAQVERTLNNSLQSGSDCQFECTVLRSDGTEVVTYHETEAVSSASGVPIRLLGTIQDITERRSVETRIHTLAHYDQLTNLPNRNFFYDHVRQSIAHTRRTGLNLAVMFLDLDGFKNINDSLGHDAGDEMLKTIGSRLSDTLRKGDLAARLGGDEFCVLLENLPDDSLAANIAGRLLTTLGKPTRIGTNNIYPRASIGIALFPRYGDNLEALIQSADNAMYAAKEAGKHRYAFYRPEMTVLAEQRLGLENDLRIAVERGDFELHYQPQISLETGRMTAVEALIRWWHPERGLVPPDKFIPVVEKIGLIAPLGEWVLHTASRQMVEWRELSLPLRHVAVNISGSHFSDNTLAQTLTDVMDQTGIQASELEIEITEGVIQTTEESIHSFHQIKDLGIKIAIDDFGTGYSCLGSLTRLPLDCLKIDKVFIQEMLVNLDNSAIVATIIAMSRVLGFSVVAEGVETLEQVQYLRGIDCQVVQGYFFSKPVTADKIPKLAATDFFLCQKQDEVDKRVVEGIEI